ncbi:uncharacterized protein LOC142289993 [Anomaloglossus baeobatrachus]|uniref:uncharacterized protein LOC142289993 n=1 Tax=Anomaloglossus baeobatrachus TaxID=238106 RepID=UPI003F50D46B
METILDLEGSSILSSTCTFSLTSINVRTDFFPSGRNTNKIHLEDFDTLSESEPGVISHLHTRGSRTPISENSRWTIGDTNQTTIELRNWAAIEDNSTTKFDGWSPSSIANKLFPNNVSAIENAGSEGYQEISPTLLQPETSYSKSHNVRVIKHKPSAITFTDLPLDVIFESTGYDDDTQEDKESGDDAAEDDENDDVFTDLPRYKYAFTGIKRRSSHPRSPTKIFIDSKDIFQVFNKNSVRNNGTDLGEEERKMSLEERSKWSQSMKCLMMKLEQLNVDIEGAINASSNPLYISHDNSEEQCLLLFLTAEDITCSS